MGKLPQREARQRAKAKEKQARENVQLMVADWGTEWARYLKDISNGEPQERAWQRMNRALAAYRRAIKENP